MAKIIERAPRAFVGVKMDDGTAELLGATMAGPIDITGDGTLQHPLKAVPTVHLREGIQFGCPVFKPVCNLAAGIASIAKTSTITPVTINYLKAMGFRVMVDGAQPREL